MQIRIFFKCMFILRESMYVNSNRGEAERERRERIPSRFCAVNTEPYPGLYLLMNCEIMT